MHFLKKLFRFSSLFQLSYYKMENIGELPYGVLGTVPKFGLREEIEFVPLLTFSKQRRKMKFNVVFVQVVKKSPQKECKICCFSFTYSARFV